MSQIELTVEGMTCGHCQKAVSDALRGVPGVTGAQVDLERGTARVEGSPDPQALLAAVAEEGYRARVARP